MKFLEKTAMALALVSFACPARATVADLQALQAAQPSVACQYTFEGADEADQLAQKVGEKTPSLKQAIAQPRRQVDFLTPGYDASTRCAAFSAFASGVQGDCLRSAAPIRLSTTGTLEFMVRPGAVSRENAMIAGEASGANARWHFLAYNGKQACVALGSNTPRPLFGEGTGVPYAVGDWYYVTIIWSVSLGNLTLNAWVSHVSAKSPRLTQTIVNAVGPFDGNGEMPLFLGSLNGSQKFAAGSLDALAVYGSALDFSAISTHHDAILKP